MTGTLLFRKKKENRVAQMDLESLRTRNRHPAGPALEPYDSLLYKNRQQGDLGKGNEISCVRQWPQPGQRALTEAAGSRAMFYEACVSPTFITQRSRWS